MTLLDLKLNACKHFSNVVRKWTLLLCIHQNVGFHKDFAVRSLSNQLSNPVSPNPTRFLPIRPRFPPVRLRSPSSPIPFPLQSNPVPPPVQPRSPSSSTPFRLQFDPVPPPFRPRSPSSPTPFPLQSDRVSPLVRSRSPFSPTMFPPVQLRSP